MPGKFCTSGSETNWYEMICPHIPRNLDDGDENQISKQNQNREKEGARHRTQAPTAWQIEVLQEHGKVESKERFPLFHIHDCGGVKPPPVALHQQSHWYKLPGRPCRQCFFALPTLWNTEDYSRPETQGILYIGSSIGKLCAHPIGLEYPDAKVAR